MEIKCNSSLIYFEEELSCYHRYPQVTEHTIVYIAHLKIYLGNYEGPRNIQIYDRHIYYFQTNVCYLHDLRNFNVKNTNILS